MNTFNLKGIFKEHFEKLNLKKNEHVVIHSDLSTFGIMDKKIYKVVLDVLIKLIGKNGTIIMPSYDFNNKKNYIYNYKKVNKNNGRLVNLFSKKSNIKKSKSLIHSHLGLGKKSYILNKSKINKSFGKNTDFEFFIKEKFKLLLLGCKPSIGATIFHHFEYEAKVPYRKEITISKNYMINKNIKKIYYQYFERITKNKFELDKAFEKILDMAKSSKKVKNKFGDSYTINLREMRNITVKILKKNINFLIRK